MTRPEFEEQAANVSIAVRRMSVTGAATGPEARVLDAPARDLGVASSEPRSAAGRAATSEGVRTMRRQAKRAGTLRALLDEDRALLDAADAIGDMIRLNGAERAYASEKLGYALYKAAEGLALCDATLDEVTEEVRRGHQHGLYIREDAR
jgi:hypothetical protein